jgi:hypothetical protein
MDYRQTTHRVLVGRLASGLAFAILIICSASVCAETPQQAAPPPPAASQQTAAQPPTRAQEEMREFRLRIRDYTKFVAQHPRTKKPVGGAAREACRVRRRQHAVRNAP